MSKTGEIIAINGLAGAGKSTSADYFLKKGFVRVKMADTLKRMTAVLLESAGIPENDIWRLIEGTLSDKNEPITNLRGNSCRHIMKMLGTEFRDLIYSDMWVDIACLKVRRLLDSGKRVVIDDIRFDHEVAYLTYTFGQRVQFVKVEGPDHDELEFTDAHASEVPMADEKFTHVLRNDGTIPQLHECLRRVYWEADGRKPGYRMRCSEVLLEA